MPSDYFEEEAVKESGRGEQPREFEDFSERAPAYFSARSHTLNGARILSFHPELDSTLVKGHL